MLKRFICLFFPLCLFLCGCVSNQVPPDWVNDKEAVYPVKKYLAGVGHGATQQEAQNTAVAEISRYIQTSVESTIQSEFKAILVNGKSDESRTLVQKVTTSSAAALNGIQYAPPYYDRKGKQWYSAAYITRTDAWEHYHGTVIVAQKIFDSFYDGAAEKDPLRAIAWYKKAQNASDDLMQKLLMANVIDPSRENIEFAAARDRIASVPLKIAQCGERCSFFFSVAGDTNAIIETTLKKSVAVAGASVSVSQKNAAYVLAAVVQLHEEKSGTGDDTIYAAYPSVDITVTRETDTVFSTSVRAEEKTAAYHEDALARSALNKLAVPVADAMNKEFTAMMAE